MLIPVQQTSESTYTDYLVQVCETFGRYTLHKEAFTKGSMAMTFSVQVSFLLHWTTANVIPAFRQVVPFSDPNLSCIQIDHSFATVPASPELQSRDKRINRNKTPERVDETSTLLFHSPTAEETKRIDSQAARTFALCLLKSSCILFSEWVAVGGSDVTLVAQAVVESWFQVFANGEEASETTKELVPAFCRLAIQLARSGADYRVLEQILKCIHEIKGDLEVLETVRKSIQALLSTRGSLAEDVVRKTVHCVLEVAYESINERREPCDFQLPSTLYDLWSYERGCISTALSVIFSSKVASTELAKQLVSDFLVHTSNESTGFAIFDAKCLWLLCGKESKICLEMREHVRKLNPSNTFGEDLRMGVMELINSLQT